MSQHKITATWVFDADLGAEVEVEITFEFRKGAPAQGPSYASGGQPADPDEIEFISAKANVLSGDAFDDLRQAALNEWARGWIESGENDAEIYAEVEADDERGREFAAELMADR